VLSYSVLHQCRYFMI